MRRSAGGGTVRRSTASASGIALALCVAALSPPPAAAQTGTELTVSKAQAEAAFGVLLLFPCLTHVERGVPIADLPDVYRSGIVRAQGADARFALGRETATAVWTSTLMGSHIRVAEFGPAKCVITADQLPVEDTLGKAAQATEKLDPAFAEVSVKPGYWPVIHQTERTADGKHIVVRLEGAEPGLAGHAYRFSLMLATVTATPAP